MDEQSIAWGRMRAGPGDRKVCIDHLQKDMVSILVFVFLFVFAPWDSIIDTWDAVFVVWDVVFVVWKFCINHLPKDIVSILVFCIWDATIDNWCAVFGVWKVCIDHLPKDMVSSPMAYKVLWWCVWYLSCHNWCLGCCVWCLKSLQRPSAKSDHIWGGHFLSWVLFFYESYEPPVKRYPEQPHTIRSFKSDLVFLSCVEKYSLF